MSVIAKMNVAGIRPFGETRLINLSCVYEHDGLNTERFEDRRFTKATPWGEGQLTAPNVVDSFTQGGQVYLVFVSHDPPVSDPGIAPRAAMLTMCTKVHAVTDMGGTSKQVEIVIDNESERSFGNPAGRALNLRLAIDNPAASDQFIEGRRFYMAVYDASKVTIDQAAAGE